MTSLRSMCVSAAFLLASACSVADFYDDQEYVLFDSSPPPARGSSERAESDRLAASTDATDATAAERELDRVFVLENLRDELGRAIADGIGDVEALKVKRADVEREIAWRVAEAGEAYTKSRAERVARLQAFPIVIR